MKTISYRDFLRVSKSDFLPVTASVRILGRSYCSKMARLNKCTLECSDCKAHLANIFARARSVQNPVSKAAILTWAAREEIGRIGDSTEYRTTESSDENIFKALGELL